VAEPAVSASPVARRTAAKLGVVLEAVTGSGPRGRVFKADVAAAAREAAASARETTASARELTAAPAPLDLVAAVDVDVGALVAFRDDLAAIAERAPSIDDLVVKAVALALREVEGAGVDVGVAVPADGGLVLRVVRGADGRSLGAIGDGTVMPEPDDAPPITVCSLGVDRFAARLDPPQPAVLCVGAIARHAVVGDDDAIVARPMAELTLVCDAREIGEADAASLLAALRTTLEQPLRLLV
jgi:pyruvate dehydrogenase E2 component (dihydrolipoamide acetyltransferase)